LHLIIVVKLFTHWDVSLGEETVQIAMHKVWTVQRMV
jgi:hypothetical protein